MLIQRKSLVFVALCGEKYLSFMLLKVRKWTVISSAKNYQNYLKRVTKETALAPFNLAHPVDDLWPWIAHDLNFKGMPLFDVESKKRNKAET